jgi:hypothetical protein
VCSSDLLGSVALGADTVRPRWCVRDVSIVECIAQREKGTLKDQVNRPMQKTVHSHQGSI